MNNTTEIICGAIDIFVGLTGIIIALVGLVSIWILIEDLFGSTQLSNAQQDKVNVAKRLCIGISKRILVITVGVLMTIWAITYTTNTENKAFAAIETKITNDNYSVYVDGTQVELDNIELKDYELSYIKVDDTNQKVLISSHSINR